MLFGVIGAVQDLGVDFSRGQMVTHERFEFVEATSGAACEDVDKTGIVLGIGVQAGVAFGQEQQDGDAAIGKDMMAGAQNCGTGGCSTPGHGLDQTGKIAHLLALAALVAGQHVQTLEGKSAAGRLCCWGSRILVLTRRLQGESPGDTMKSQCGWIFGVEHGDVFSMYVQQVADIF